MKKINYIFGFLLLFIGVILILSNFGVIEIIFIPFFPVFTPLSFYYNNYKYSKRTWKKQDFQKIGTHPIFLLIYLAFLKIIHIPITINIIPATRPKSIKNKLLIKKNREIAPSIPTGIKSPFSRPLKR